MSFIEVNCRIQVINTLKPIGNIKFIKQPAFKTYQQWISGNEVKKTGSLDWKQAHNFISQIKEKNVSFNKGIENYVCKMCTM